MLDYTVPYTGFQFDVEFDGLFVGGFSEVSGLESQVETQDYQEGGMNYFVHKLPKNAKYPNLVLRRGICKSDYLWNWYYNTLAGSVQRKMITVYMRDRTGTQQAWVWNFFDAYPVKWMGPNFKAGVGDVAIEAVEIVHAGMTAEKLL